MSRHIDPDSASSVENAIDAIYEHIMENGFQVVPVDPTRVERLRISSFPFCQRAWFLNQGDTRHNVRRVNVVGSNFTVIGTAFHENIQTGVERLAAPPPSYAEPGDDLWKAHQLPMGAVLVQAWDCDFCGSKIPYAPYPKHSCRFCGGTKWIGTEHKVKYGRFTTGHMDGSFAFPTAHSSAQYSRDWAHVPIDYKTCSATKMARAPFVGNMEQLLSYAAIKYHDGFNVVGASLIYAGRDNPFKRRACHLKSEPAKQLRKIDEWEVLYEEARSVTTLEGALKLKGRTVPEDNYEDHCEYCQYTSVCKAASKGDMTPMRVQAEVVLRFFRERVTFPTI